MVFASRCNLLSRSLPFYQKELLSFCDKSASAFHKILVDLRSHHHHQYKVKRLLEEIRDLESEENPLVPEMQRMADDDEPLLDIGAEMFGDDILADQSPTLVEEGVATVQNDGELPPRDSDPFSFEKVLSEAGVSDMMLAGSEAALQSELWQQNTTETNQHVQELLNGNETVQTATEEPSFDKVNDLLNFEESAATDKASAEPAQEEVLDDWGNFSAFMSSSSSQKETDNVYSGWEKEFVSSTQKEPTGTDISSTLPKPTGEIQGAELPSAEDAFSDLLSDDLKLLGIDPSEIKKSVKQNQLSSDLESLDPLLFRAGQQVPPSQPPPPSLIPQQPPVFRSPMSGSRFPIIPPGVPNSQGQTGAAKGASPPKKAVKKSGGKESAWMNVFAHLDPLQNEKA